MELEELRYRWMLYKSKLQEAGDLRGLLKHKVQRKKIFSFYIKLYVYFLFRFLYLDFYNNYYLSFPQEPVCTYFSLHFFSYITFICLCHETKCF